MRKGLSPLIAVVLLVAFTIAVGAIISSWVTTFSGEQTSEISDKGDVALECTNARLSFDNDDVAANGTKLGIKVTNAGSVNLTDFLVYVTDTNDSLISFTGLNNSDSILQPGQIIEIYNISANLSKTDIKKIVVTTGPDDFCPGTSVEEEL